MEVVGEDSLKVKENDFKGGFKSRAIEIPYAELKAYIKVALITAEMEEVSDARADVDANEIAHVCALAATSKFCHHDGLLIRSKPKGVWADKVFTKGELILAPWCKSAKVIKDESTSVPKWYSFDGAMDGHIVQATPDGDNCAFSISSSTDRTIANLKVYHEEVTIKVGRKSFSIKVPMLTNTKQLKKGIELKYYRQESDDARKCSVDVD